MDKQRFVERILEVENLTDELEDPQANWLLDWGIGQLDAVLKNIVDDEVGGTRVNALMAVMRKINRMTAARQKKAPEALAADFAALGELFNLAFGCSALSTPAEQASAAAHLAQLTASQAVEFLARWGLAHSSG